MKDRKVIRKNKIMGKAHVISHDQYRKEAIMGYTPGDIYFDKKTGKELPSQLGWNSVRKCWQ